MSSNNPFTNIRVAVTGGTSGLGLALVHLLHERGARVAFVARHRERVDEVARTHPGTHGIVGDVAVKDDIYPMALQILGELGGLDVLVNNASDLGPTPLALLGDTECEDLERALATNVLGPFRLTKALLGALAASAREGRGAVVLNVSSDAAVNAYPTWGAYSASKAALRHLTHIWDAEIAEHDGGEICQVGGQGFSTGEAHLNRFTGLDMNAMQARRQRGGVVRNDEIAGPQHIDELLPGDVAEPLSRVDDQQLCGAHAAVPFVAGAPCSSRACSVSAMASSSS